MKKKTLVFTATYNEFENIQNFITAVHNNNPEVDILIIDDNSPDKTYELVEDLGKKINNIFLIKRSHKLGLDTAHKEAYEFALANKYEYLITMDADLSHDPKEISNFVKYLENHEFVIGSRYMVGGECLMSRKRLTISKYGNLFIKLILNLNCNEFTTSYRGFNLLKLKNFHLNLIREKGYSFFMGTVHHICSKKFTYIEIPITFKDRQKGESKIPKIEILRTLINLFKLKIKN
tara:strand:+ start:1147 stop:1848 length:702 start_codon:yes stop_codon:yes gene_type:complete